LYIDKDVSFDLKQTLLYFTKEMFENQKFVASVHSTEPSAEIDIYWGLKPKQITITKGTGWLEIGGCGMVTLMFLKTVASTLMSTTVLPLEWE
jgi:phenylalanyl-tRNA synthetase alpha chain